MTALLIVVVGTEAHVELLVLPDLKRLKRRNHNQLSDIELVTIDYSAIVDQESILDVLLAHEVSVARAKIVHDIVEGVRYVDTSPSGQS